jgi:cobalt-zinc-cadmium efflux system outer membrane protein
MRSATRKGSVWSAGSRLASPLIRANSSSLKPHSSSADMRGSSSTSRMRVLGPFSRRRAPNDIEPISGAGGSIGLAEMNAMRFSIRQTRVRPCRWFQVAVAVIGSLGVPVAAQVAIPSSLSLAAAVDRAMAANPMIAAARLATAINQAGLAIAGERPNPEVTAEFERETPKQGFGVAVPFELGGKRSKRVALSQATIRAGEAEIAATIVHIRNDVRRAYYDALVAEARLSVLRELRDLSGRVRDTAVTRFESGDAPRLEVLQAGLALAASENDAAAAEGALTAARTRLNALLGQPLDAWQTLSTALDAGAPMSLEVALNLARAGSAELAVLDRRLDEQRAKIALAQALRTPDLIPTATLTHDAQPEFTYGWRAGLAVTLPIFTTHKAGVLVAQATLDQLLAQRQAAGARITGEVTAAAAIAEAQRLAYTRYRDVILPQAQQVEQLAQDSYQLGETGIAALLQALQASRDVRLRALDAMAHLQMTVADLERAIGAPLP